MPRKKSSTIEYNWKKNKHKSEGIRKGKQQINR